MPTTLFKEQPKGYDKKQVKNYIRRLTKAYETTYREYLDTVEKYDELLKISSK